MCLCAYECVRIFACVFCECEYVCMSVCECVYLCVFVQMYVHVCVLFLCVCACVRLRLFVNVFFYERGSAIVCVCLR